MPHYICKSCKKYFFTNKKVPITKKCPDCGNRLALYTRRTHEKLYQDEVDMDSMVFIRRIKGIQRSTRPEISRKRKRPSDWDEEEDDDEDEDDKAWCPPSTNFNIGMRLTSQPMGMVRSRTNTFVNKTHTKIKEDWIKGNAGKKNPGYIMGVFLKKPKKKVKSISADKYVSRMFGKEPLSGNRKKKKRRKYLEWLEVNYEWCHMIGDCLGGNTEAGNLVAGSYSANTYMLALEKLLKGRSELYVRVKVYCVEAHIAEFIKYEVYNSKKLLFVTEIDAQIKYFNKNDYQTIQGELRKAIGTKK